MTKLSLRVPIVKRLRLRVRQGRVGRGSTIHSYVGRTLPLFEVMEAALRGQIRILLVPAMCFMYLCVFSSASSLFHFLCPYSREGVSTVSAHPTAKSLWPRHGGPSPLLFVLEMV